MCRPCSCCGARTCFESCADHGASLRSRTFSRVGRGARHLHRPVLAQVQEALEDALTKFEVQMADIIKWMQERAADFFRELESHEKGFANQLTEGMQNEFETQQGQDMLHAEGEGKQMPNRDDMLQVPANCPKVRVRWSSICSAPSPGCSKISHSLATRWRP